MRRRLMILFSASVLLTLACITQSVVILTTHALVTLIVGLSDVCLFAAHCNLVWLTIPRIRV